MGYLDYLHSKLASEALRATHVSCVPYVFGRLRIKWSDLTFRLRHGAAPPLPFESEAVVGVTGRTHVGSSSC